MSRNAFGALMLGIGQAIGGALAMVFSAGVYGMGLIAEGISDIVAGIVSIVKGDGASSRLQHKAYSLTDNHWRIRLADALVLSQVRSRGPSTSRAKRCRSQSRSSARASQSSAKRSGKLGKRLRSAA